VLLAELAVALNPGWVATGVTVDASLRPFLVPTRLLQEAFFEEAGAVIGGPSYQTVAAGVFNITGAVISPSFNLTATAGANGEFLLQFPSYQNPLTTPTINYIVKGTVQDTTTAAPLRATFEMVRFEAGGIRVRILDTTSKPLGAGFGFMAEVSQIGGGS
jgi:hypothetical protein